MENGFSKSKGLLKALNVILIPAIIGTVCVTITFMFVFGMMFVFEDVFNISTDGILGFFLETIQEGEISIQGSELALCALPSVIGFCCLLANLILAKSFLRKSIKAESLIFKGAQGRLNAITTICFVWAIVPRLISEYTARTLDSELFSIVQWNVFGYLLLAAVMLTVTVIYRMKIKMNGE